MRVRWGEGRRSCQETEEGWRRDTDWEGEMPVTSRHATHATYPLPLLSSSLFLLLPSPSATAHARKRQAKEHSSLQQQICPLSHSQAGKVNVLSPLPHPPPVSLQPPSPSPLPLPMYKHAIIIYHTEQHTKSMQERKNGYGDGIGWEKERNG